MIRLVLSRAVAERIVRALHELACARAIVEELGARLWLYLTEYQGLVLVHIVRMRVEPEEPRGR